jgi:cytochrome c oxidase assembly protein subunit 15
LVFLHQTAQNMDLAEKGSRPLHWFAFLTAAATLVLLGIGGLVTSHGAGMAVPDWPTTYGYNMFFFPFSYWMGGIFYEHSHRLVATLVGVLVGALTRWLGGRPSRLPLAIIGGRELSAGLVLGALGPNWRGAGHFLAGIGGVVLLAAAVWARNAPAPRPLPLLAWVAFFGVQIQGLLGGLRVVLFQDEIGIFHATLAQLFFLLLCLVVLLTSRWWRTLAAALSTVGGGPSSRLSWWMLAATALILFQLMIGATMRHQHAGLAIPDFPLAYGKLWPAMDADSVAAYNQQRLEVTALNPITAFQIGLQMTHRLVALLILVAVGVCAAKAWRLARRSGRAQGAVATNRPVQSLARISLVWFGLILVQALLGAATIWSNKAADLATAHVIFGALSLALGGIVTVISFKLPAPAQAGLPVLEPGGRQGWNATANAMSQPFSSRPLPSGAASHTS